MLKYVCEQYLGGQGQDVKEYNIAVEAFKRPPDFDQGRDSIVRVEAHRLRKRLLEYYSTEGADRSTQIVVPSGTYLPQFIRRPQAAAEPLPVKETPVAHESAPVSEAFADSAAVESPAPDVVPPDVGEASADPAMIESAALVVAPPDSARRGGRRWMVYLLAAVAMVAIASSFWRGPSRRPSAMVASAMKTPEPVLLPRDEIRILAGSRATQFLDHYGNAWSGDRYYEGGEALDIARRHIFGTLDPDIFCRWRQGTFSYTIPLKKGTYELRLYFSEMLYGEDNVAGRGESARVFRILANNKELIHFFDVIRDAPGSNTADIKVFRDIQPAEDGMLHLRFVSPMADSPFVNAIELVPSQPGTIRPIRIVARDSSYTDEENQMWSADRYFRGGVLVQRHDPVAGTSDVGLYQNERYGNFSYAIPVALGGRYDVTLKFCESWMGPNRPGNGGAGSRVFDVSFNGRMLLPNFDIWKQAGSLRALDKTFKGLEPNEQGKLVFSFTPSHNYAIVNAIEVTDEAWK